MKFCVGLILTVSLSQISWQVQCLFPHCVCVSHDEVPRVFCRFCCVLSRSKALWCSFCLPSALPLLAVAQPVFLWSRVPWLSSHPPLRSPCCSCEPACSELSPYKYAQSEYTNGLSYFFSFQRRINSYHSFTDFHEFYPLASALQNISRIWVVVALLRPNWAWQWMSSMLGQHWTYCFFARNERSPLLPCSFFQLWVFSSWSTLPSPHKITFLLGKSHQCIHITKL